MKRTISLLALALLAGSSVFAQQTETVASPDGKYQFTFRKTPGKMTYTLTFNGKPVLNESNLGVDIDNRLFESALGIHRDTCRNWCENLTLKQADRLSKDSVWTPLYGENQLIKEQYNSLILHLEKGGATEGHTGDGYDKRRYYAMDIEVRAYNEGVAFRYHFPETSNGLFLNIRGEQTTFSLPSGTMAWWEEWAQGPYHYQSLAECKEESERPLLMKLSDGTYVALLEAGLTDYARGKFAYAGNHTLKLSMYDGAEVISPYNTPWRVVMAGQKATDLINHKDLILNLNEPCCLKDTSFIRPGRAFRCGKLEKEAIEKSIDFCAKHGIEYVELDAGWYGPEMKVSSDASKVSAQRNFQMADICSYAKSKGVGVWIYVNQRALYHQLETILPLYQKWGIKGIKFGFVQVGNQQWTTWLHKAVQRCADFGLMVDIHDEYRPTGVSRTLPNLLTQEGIRGNEEMPDATHNTILPFTRYLCGPADYTLCYFNPRVKNTHAHQLAMAVVYYSPLQFLYWYDAYNTRKEEKELKFWDDAPSVWDESKALDGEPGQFIVQARRSKQDWFVGILNGKKARTITLDTRQVLDKKGNYTVEIYTDDASLQTRTNVKTQVRKVKKGERITLTLPSSGGAALHFIRQ